MGWLTRQLARVIRWITCLWHRNSIRIDYKIDGEPVMLTRFDHMRYEKIFWSVPIPKRYAMTQTFAPYIGCPTKRPKHVVHDLVDTVHFNTVVSVLEIESHVPIKSGCPLIVTRDGDLQPVDYPISEPRIGTVLSCRYEDNSKYILTVAIGNSHE